ncbi:hypothetical protein CIF47_RS07255 [Vibrio parahaemolyticus]|nr:hypothetical protein [Vibrio parahaemolyticus]EJG1589883.1 hypothetical protein [Vibrio parahaemolyticus]HCZ9714525.1 hypothetical protein [Vibrio parahaemolyticus]
MSFKFSENIWIRRFQIIVYGAFAFPMAIALAFLAALIGAFDAFGNGFRVGWKHAHIEMEIKSAAKGWLRLFKGEDLKNV